MQLNGCSHQVHLILTTQAWKQTSGDPSGQKTTLLWHNVAI